MKKIVSVAMLLLIIITFALPSVSLAAFNIGLSDRGISGSVSGSNGFFSFGGGSGSGGGWNTNSLSTFGLPQGSITGIVINILNWLLMIFGFLGIIGFIISGIMYILAAGDEKSMETAKNAMKYSIIGVVVGLVGFVAIQAINAVLNAGFSGNI